MHVMNGSKGICPCINCTGVTPSTGIKYQAPVKRLAAAGPQDVVWKYIQACVDSCDQNTGDRMDIVFDAEQNHLKESLEYHPPEHGQFVTEQSKSHSFEPRVGEIVLFYCHDSHCVHLEESTQKYKLYDEVTDNFLDHPEWMAGLVNLTPDDGVLTLRDLIAPTDEVNELNHKSYSIELLDDSRHRSQGPSIFHVDIRHIRPFSFFRELLTGLPQSRWHQSIKSAWRYANGLSHVEMFRFLGDHSSAYFQCRGLWIGYELVTIGDVVRIKPSACSQLQPKIMDVLLVKSINLACKSLAQFPEIELGFVLRGKVFSVLPPSPTSIPYVGMDATDAVLRLLDLPECMRGYTWYDISRGKEVEVSPFEVIGRCYQHEAMVWMIDSSEFNVGYEGIQKLREFVSADYQRRMDWEQYTREEWDELRGQWYNDRFEMLGTEYFRGEAVGNRRERENRSLDHNGVLSRKKIKAQEQLLDNVSRGYAHIKRRRKDFSADENTIRSGTGSLRDLSDSNSENSGQNDRMSVPMHRMSAIRGPSTVSGMEDEAELFISQTLEDSDLAEVGREDDFDT